MIKTFKDKETETVFAHSISTKLPYEIHRRAIKKLMAIHLSTTINDLKVPPSNHLEKLQENRAGQYSIRINKQWRICFIFENGNAFDVEIVDYH
jgi:proteic killer suppression protein